MQFEFIPISKRADTPRAQTGCVAFAREMFVVSLTADSETEL